MEEYQGGFEVKQINRQEESVEFVNGMKLYAGDINGKVDEEQIRRIQIRETILSHIDRERRLFGRRIKVLSLFLLMKLPVIKSMTKRDVLKTAVMRTYLKKSTVTL